MAQSGQRKCLCCGEFFDSDHRNRERQRYCADTACRRASKAASQAAWLAQPHNKDYFSDPVHVTRVQAWRAAHPGYSRSKPASAAALQDPLIVQVDDFVEESAIRGEVPASSALQDVLNPLSPILAGLIAHLFELTLQDDIATTTRRLIQLGHDVIYRSRHEDSQTSAAPRATAAQVPEQFSWVDQALVARHFIDRCDARTAALYLFLVTVADAQGLSYYGAATLAQRLHLSAEELGAARQQLMELDLIAYQAPLYQVLAIAGTQAASRQAPKAAAAPPASPRARATNAGPVSLAELIELERRHARL